MTDPAFSVKAQASLDQSQIKAIAEGSVSHPVTVAELEAFGLANKLRDSVEKNFGEKPKVVYYKRDEDPFELFKKYAWMPLQTKVTARDPKNIKVASDGEVVYNLNKFTNNGPNPATFHASATVQVETSMSESWSKSGSVSVDQSISYGLTALGLGGETSFNFTSGWSSIKGFSDSTTLGETAGVEVPLNPGQSAYVVIKAQKGTLTMTVPYEATLLGGLAVNYDPTYKDHHFWYLHINNILKSCGLPKKVTIEQTLTFAFFTNVSVTVHDCATDKVISSQTFDQPMMALAAVEGTDGASLIKENAA
ncbi:hypothetical protein [Pseudoblastomonas halimionae]|uniref:Follicular epithelium yolk protein subunit n=1 Tax=Alteriqipengyuania halimionae TaxID=1926630 RepID=A0A6I4U6C0_9SPHN|nr:hypothetical protein [Alteriqipengyuania halimionae]MXP09827.1 hypothetical protein [Alteriqipengyuania halimionae]